MSTLFLTQRFPPHTGAAARRLRFLAGCFAERGDLYVIRSGEEAETLPSVKEMVSIPRLDLRRLATKNDSTIANARKERPLVRFLLRLRQAFPFVYLTDDGGVDYRKRAFAAACKIIEREGVMIIFSSFRPWSDHLVARRLKAKYPYLRWVADFRDLPVDPVRQDVWFPTLQHWWGKRVVRGADEVWAVSDGQKVQLAGWHPNVCVRRNPLLVLPPERTAPVTDRFTITYTGSLYPGLQTVWPLIRGLVELLDSGTISADKLCLLYRGKDADTFRRWTADVPDDCLDIAPSIAPAAAQKIQQNATVLLLLNWSAPGYYGVLTAKLWDYLATGRPVLALVNGPGDEELEDIILGAAAGAVFKTKEQGKLKTWLASAYREWEKAGTFAWAPSREKLAAYLPKTQA